MKAPNTHRPVPNIVTTVELKELRLPSSVFLPSPGLDSSEGVRWYRMQRLHGQGAARSRQRPSPQAATNHVAAALARYISSKP